MALDDVPAGHSKHTPMRSADHVILHLHIALFANVMISFDDLR